MRGRRLWMRVRAHGGTIPVYVVKTDLYQYDGDGDGETELDAYYDQGKPEIVVRQTDNTTLMKQRLHHELLHACFGAHTADGLAALGAFTPAGRAKREEDIVSFLEPIQFDMLTRNGFLRYPNPPRVK